MLKKLACLSLTFMMLLAASACGGSEGKEPAGSDTPVGEEPGGNIPSGPEDPTPPAEQSVWNREPTVKATYYEDFSEGIDWQNDWEVSDQKWGADNHGTSHNNVFYTTNETRVASAGGTGGIAVLRSFGDLQPDANKRRQGSALISKRLFGPGKYEVRMKVLPRLGQCTAFWTYYSNGSQDPNTIKYSEIDIEMPMEGTYKKWSGTSYERFIDWNVLAERQTITSDFTSGLNDGQWHTYCFEWRTDRENGDRGVVWYRDGVKLGEARENVPIYTAALWVGNWFPPDASWVGVPDFEEAYMYIDWIRVTEYNDPSQPGGGASPNAGGQPTDLGAKPIPQNQYIANGSGANIGENNALLGWTGEGTKGTSESGTYIALDGGKRLTQMIRAQYAGYSFTLSAEALAVAGEGKCKVYAEYMLGTVSFGKTEQIVFDASDLGEKSLSFDITNTNADGLRIVLETEEGTTAQLTNIKLVMN